MKRSSPLAKIIPALTCSAVAACTAANVQPDVPDSIMQQSLDTLTREQSFTWFDATGQNLVIRPLGTFRSGGNYCRDYEVSFADAGDTSARRTACRIDDRWTRVDPSELDL